MIAGAGGGWKRSSLICAGGLEWLSIGGDGQGREFVGPRGKSHIEALLKLGRDEISHHMADAYGRHLPPELTLRDSSSLSLSFSTVEWGGGERGGPRKSPRDYGLSLLRPPAANPKEANAMKRASR